MLVHPRHGQPVQIWYNKRIAPTMPLHGRTGTVQIIARGKGPRNHGVEIDGQVYAVPCGNLRKAKEMERE
jgi:hypothetical protein